MGIIIENLCKNYGKKEVLKNINLNIPVGVYGFWEKMVLEKQHMSFESLVPLYEYSIDTGIAIDIFAFLKYIFWWLLPTAMIVIAIGMFFTILTSTPVAILIQFVWWFLDSAATGLSGDTKWYTLMIRHNQLKGSEIIRQNLEVICVNRGLLVLFSVLLLWLSVVVYKKRRGGKLEYGRAAEKYWRFF